MLMVVQFKDRLLLAFKMVPKDPHFLVAAPWCSLLPLHQWFSVTSGSYGGNPGVTSEAKNHLKHGPLPPCCLDLSLSLEAADCHIMKMPKQPRKPWFPVNNQHKLLNR